MNEIIHTVKTEDYKNNKVANCFILLFFSHSCWPLLIMIIKKLLAKKEQQPKRER